MKREKLTLKLQMKVCTGHLQCLILIIIIIIVFQT